MIFIHMYVVTNNNENEKIYSLVRGFFFVFCLMIILLFYFAAVIAAKLNTPIKSRKKTRDRERESK